LNFSFQVGGGLHTISFAQDSTIPALDERYGRYQEASGV